MAGAGQAATLLGNGSFEDPGGKPIRQTIGNNDVDVTGWLHQGGFEIYESSGQDADGSAANNPVNASDGDYYVSFGHSGATGGWLEQGFLSQLGVTYVLNYDIRLQQGDETHSGFNVTASNGANVYSGDAHNAGWKSGAALVFTGDGNEIKLRFTDATTTGGANLALDNVRLSVSGAPEPAAWALMITGFVGAGAVLRRGRKLATAA